jgi:hypothetical protein
LIIQGIANIKSFITKLFIDTKNIIYSKLFKVKFGVEPKVITLNINNIDYKLICYRAVVTYLITNKDMVFYFLDLQKYNLANNLIFSYLKSYNLGLAQFENSTENFTETINYLYKNVR